MATTAPRTLCAVREASRQDAFRIRAALEGIENNCRREDPAFPDRMNLTAVQQRSSRSVLMAQCAISVGWSMLMIGGGLARGAVSTGTFVACYGLILIVAGAVAWLRNRSLRTWVQSG